MVADLLEAHEVGQDEAAALDAVGSRPSVLAASSTASLVERPPGASLKRAVGLHLRLVRQIGDDALVGLQPPQDVGPHQAAAAGRNGVAGAGLQPLDERPNSLAEPSRPGHRNRRATKIAERVLDRRAGQGDPRRLRQLLDRAGLLVEPAFLIAWASSSIDSRQRSARSMPA